MPPQSVNAYYSATGNEIVFPAGILQAPFFDANADEAVNFGVFEAVAGHEVSHAFDDWGSQYDSEGVLKDWWTPQDAAEYEKRLEVIVDQASRHHVNGYPVDGELTKGENIADLGGIQLALRALRSQPDCDASARIDGWSPVQRLFLAWAQGWRQNITPESSRYELDWSLHAPTELR